MKKLTNLLAIMVFMFTIHSCKKNEIAATDPIVPYDPGTTVTTTVAGKVLNQTGDALNGVTITIGSQTVVTDASGSFIIPKATLSKNAGVITATKAGYFTGSRTIRPKESVVNNIVIQMIKKTVTGSFTNASGGTVTTNGSAKIDFPAGAVVTKSGAAYTGTVKVSAYYLDPTSNTINTEMPGDLRGINANNNEQILTSYGMVNVELNGSNGEALQLATGKQATLTMPLPSATQGAAPATIPLWYFDETKGMWIEQGTATKTGNTYVGTVSHFTWWNCDWGGGPLTLTAKFVDANGNPLNNYHVYYITNTGWGGGGGHGYTASDGSLTGNIPANQTIVVKVMSDQCNSTLYTATVGPFTQNTDLGSITVILPTNTLLQFKGTVVDCNNNPVANGYAIIHFGNDTRYSYISNGNLNSINWYCSTVPTGTATIDIFDMSTLKKNASPITVNVTGAGTYNINQVAACGVQAFVNYTAHFVDQNGAAITNYLYVDLIPRDSLQSSLTNGNFAALLMANKVYTRKVYVVDNCNNYVMVDSTQIGPFSSDFNAGTVNLNIPQATSITISGTVTNCSNANVSSGNAAISFNGRVYNAAITNGSFSQPITLCNGATGNATITVTDNTANQQNATPITVALGTSNVNIGTVQACGVSVSEYFNVATGGVNYSLNDSLIGYKSGANTMLSGYSFNSSVGLDATITGSAVGTFGANVTYREGGISYFSSTVTPVNFTITEYGAVGGFIAGTFSGNVFQPNVANSKAISGSFRVKRLQ